VNIRTRTDSCNGLPAVACQPITEPSIVGLQVLLRVDDLEVSLKVHMLSLQSDLYTSLA